MSRTTDPTLTEHHLQRIEHALQQARNALLMGVTSGPAYRAALTETSEALRLLEIHDHPLLPAPAAE